MSNHQDGITDSVPQHGRHLFFMAPPDASAERALQALRDITDGSVIVAGLGQSLLNSLGSNVPGMAVFQSHAGAGFEVPSTPCALWCWLRGSDRGELVHHSRQLERSLAPDLTLSYGIDVFKFKSGLDLSGYEDGTENPEGEVALQAALVSGMGPGLDGSSFVAVQQWLHDLNRFEAMPAEVQDNTIGRHRVGNEEIEDAPPSAHVKRTSQESFDPEAFILRRSMPWANDKQAGLMFVAFGKSLAAYEALLHRMVGKDDGIVDALFSFTHPVSGNYFWCPPMLNGRLDLSAIGLKP